MGDRLLWGAPASYTLLVAGDGSTPTLKNLANNAQVLSAAIDNSSSRHRFLALDLKCRFASSPSAGGYVAVYLLPSLDGTNYPDGDASIDAPGRALVGTFDVRAVTTAQRPLTVELIPIGPWPFKLLVENLSGQAMTNTDDENQLYGRLYSEELG